MLKRIFQITIVLNLIFAGYLQAGGGSSAEAYDKNAVRLPVPLESYEATEAELGIEGLGEKLIHRIQEDPFNVVATLLFLCAVLHTFAAGWFRNKAHELEHKHIEAISKEKGIPKDQIEDTSFSATIMHFFGEVEAIFGIWCVPLILTIIGFHGWDAVTNYIDHSVHYTEPLFVIVIMAIASTRPVLKISELVLGKIALLGKGSPKAWWFSILIVAPLLGSFITEPAAMTIAAILLGHQIYRLDPSPMFKYGTLGLLFVNVSVGGTLTHFAAPPVLMVASKWDWGIQFMFTHFGWKAILGILVATTIYGFFFKKEFVRLAEKAKSMGTDSEESTEEPIPFWITLVVLAFMGWTVFNLHHPPLFLGGFLFFLAFVQATATHQDDVSIKNPLLVGFFLAGLVTHGALQQWWIAPVLSSLGELSLFTGATVLTAFNDNAAITFLASQVPQFDPSYGPSAISKEYAVVAGAVTGGGLTVIANAPNPAGQSLLQKYFQGGISPFGLLKGALVPTVIMAFAFMIIR